MEGNSCSAWHVDSAAPPIIHQHGPVKVLLLGLRTIATGHRGGVQMFLLEALQSACEMDATCPSWIVCTPFGDIAGRCDVFFYTVWEKCGDRHQGVERWLRM